MFTQSFFRFLFGFFCMLMLGFGVLAFVGWRDGKQLPVADTAKSEQVCCR